MRDAFIGIDVAFAKGKRLPVSICTWRDGCLVPESLRLLRFQPPLGRGNVGILHRDAVRTFAEKAGRYVREACTYLHLVPRRIGIDAPSSPRREHERRRSAEVAMDRAGISCFGTPSASEFEGILEKVRRHLGTGGPENRIPHANQLWMLVGFELFRELSKLAPCIEVFPQATVRVLGAGDVHKFHGGAVEAQLSAAALHTGWPSERPDEPRFKDIAFGPAHDRLDAYLSAWVAALDEEERVAFGSPPDDVIWTPRVEAQLRVQPEPATEVQTTLTLQAPVSHDRRPDRHQRPCPACGEHLFKRWPFGWDAHAAHRCSGLWAVGPEERKREFRRRFQDLFPGRRHN